MNSQSESKADGPQQTPYLMMKTFFDSRSDYLLELQQTKNSTRIRIKQSKETDPQYNPIRTTRRNPTRSRLLLSIQKENYSPQIREGESNSQKTKNYRSSKAFRSRKTTTRRKLPVTIAKFSWPSFRILQTERPILQR